MDAMTQFWGTTIGGGLVAAMVAGIAALRQGNIALVGVSMRDFPNATGVTRPLEHPAVNAALRRAAGGWRVVWVIVISGLIMGSVNAAWDAVLPATWSVQSAGMAALRGALIVVASSWVIGRLLVASIHRHFELIPR